MMRRSAVRLLRQAVEMNPEDPGSFYLLARALRSEGHAQEANAAMQHVVQLHTSSLDAEKHALKDAGVVGAREWLALARFSRVERLTCVT